MMLTHCPFFRDIPLAKVRLSKFRGMNKDTFYLHLKECEFRFNYRKDNLYMLL